MLKRGKAIIVIVLVIFFIWSCFGDPILYMVLNEWVNPCTYVAYISLEEKHFISRRPTC